MDVPLLLQRLNLNEFNNISNLITIGNRIRIVKAIAKARRLKKLKLVRAAGKKNVVSGELMQMNRGLTTIEAKAVQSGGLVNVTSRSLLKPTNAGALSGVMTSRVARTAEKRLLGAGNRQFPKWIKSADVIEDAVLVQAKKSGRGWNIAKKAGRFGLEVAAWGVAGYYFDRAVDYFLGEDDGGGDGGDADKKGLTAKDAYASANALADEVHGLHEGWPLGLSKNFDLSKDPEFMQLFGDLTEATLRGKLSDSNFASIRAMEGYDSTKVALMMHRVTEALKLMAALTDNEATLKLMSVQSLLSDDYTVVPPMGYQILDDAYIHDDSVELAAEGHLTNIGNFVDEYRADAMKQSFDDMTDLLEITESKTDFVDALTDPKKLGSKLAIYLLASYSNDKFEDTMGMLRSFSVDNDGDDDESAMLNFISQVKQRSYAAVSILNKTIL